MKILQIAPAWVDTPPRNYGGTEWVINNLVNGLCNLGHKVTLFATKNSKTAGNLKYIFPKNLIDLNTSWNLALPSLLHYHQAFNEASKYDVVHAHLSSPTDLILMPFLSDLAEKNVPSLMTIHSPWPLDIYSYMDKYYLKKYANNISVVNISQSMRKKSPRYFRDLGVVYNSTDLDKIVFNNKPKNYLTWLGKIIPEKGLYEAIQIAKKADKQLIFAGIVDRHQQKSVQYYNKIKPLIDGKQIIYLGPANLRVKNSLLKNAKGFINPLQWEEPFGMVMVESMACGTPVIAYDRGSVQEIIKNNKTGYIVKTKSEFLKAIKNLDKIERSRCREHIEARFSPQVAAIGYIKRYYEVIKYGGVSSYDGIVKGHKQPYIISNRT